jgi:PAS domain S-box-containing protein
MRFLSDKMVFRLIGYFLLISLPTIALVTGSSYLLARKALERSIFDRLEGTAESKAQQLANWVETQRREVLFIAGSAQVRAHAENLLNPRARPEAVQRARTVLSETLNRLMRNKPDLLTIFFLSLEEGRVVLSTDTSMVGEYRVGDQYFTHGRYATYLQNVHLSLETLEPVMTLATPLVDDSGKRIGVLAASLDLERMDRTILGSTGLGRTGQAYLVDKTNVFISAPRLARRDYPRGVHSPGIEAALKGGSGLGTYPDYRGARVVGAYRWLEDLDLALLVEISQKEAYATAMRLAWLIAGLGSALALVLGVGVFILAQRIARPILAISRAASQVASGDLTARAPIITRDEVGALARSFNQMAAHLGNLYQGLEEKVAQLEQVEAALRESEKYYRDFFENDLTGDFVADAEGVIRSYNPALADILGLDPAGEAEPPNLTQFFSGGQTWEGFLKALLREDRLDYHQMVMKLRDGRSVMVVANFIAERNEEGGLREIKGYLFDDTKRLELEDQLRHSQKMEALGRLAGGVAHDFNNLMTAVTGYSDLALARLEKGHPLRAGIEQIAKAGERAASLTRQLLVFSRRQVLQTKAVDLNAIVVETERMVRRLVGENIEILTNLDPELGPVEADEGQIQQVVMNLVINARDAMPEGGLLTIETKNNHSGVFPDRGTKVPGSRTLSGFPSRTPGWAWIRRPNPGSSTPSSPPRNRARGPGWGWPRFTG